MGPTTVHLVRHATHGLLPHTLAGRLPGIALSPAGAAEAQALAAHFNHPVAAIYSSPIQRALETAAPIAAALALPVMQNPGFTEIDFGEWTGARLDALAPDPAWQAWNRFRSLARCPGGETMHEAQSRALSALADCRVRHPGATVVIVSHADIIRSMLAPILGFSLDRLYRLTIDPASISTLTLFDDDARIDAINRQPTPRSPLPPAGEDRGGGPSPGPAAG